MSGRGRAVRARARLGDRDLVLLETLQSQRLMTGKQLRRLHLPDGEPITQARKMRRALLRLTELGVVVRLNRQIDSSLFAVSRGRGNFLLLREGRRWRLRRRSS
jgi:hypothetical protein